MRQIAGTVTMADHGMVRIMICDRDARRSETLRARFQDAGIRVIQTPYRAPNAKAHAERFVRSIKNDDDDAGKDRR